MSFNKFIQYIKAEKFRQYGYSYSNDSGLSFRLVHWFQFVDRLKGTSSNMNVQCDTYQNSKSVLKAFRTSREERLQSHLISQGSFFSFIMDQSLLCLNSVWSSVQSKMPKNVSNFTVRYINSTLPTQSNLSK